MVFATFYYIILCRRDPKPLRIHLVGEYYTVLWRILRTVLNSY